MRVAVLGSGSGGNAVIVESQGRRILIDAGFSCRQIEKRLAGLGGDADFKLEGGRAVSIDKDIVKGRTFFR